MVTNDIPESILIDRELAATGLVRQPCGAYLVKSRGTEERCPLLENCLECSKSELSSLKRETFKSWDRLSNIAKQMVEKPEYNDSSCIDNLLFLSNVKKAYLLAKMFDELDGVAAAIRKVFDLDISAIDEDLVCVFNNVYTITRVMHTLIMSETYRNMLINRALGLKKIASIQGPWSHLDLPMNERIWDGSEGSEDEEYLQNRSKAKQSQLRYNPEYDKHGFFYVFPEERTRAPYRLEDRDDQVYPSRNYLRIP